jgi:hypothetical protein
MCNLGDAVHVQSDQITIDRLYQEERTWVGC